MANRIVIDPVTRIEGHLRIEVEIENGVVKDAWSTGTMARGFEAMLLGRQPMDAIYVTERSCGVCTLVHGLCSSRALDMAYGCKVPEAGVLLRNLMLAALHMSDHIQVFYNLNAPDYIDITAVAGYKGNDPKLLAIKDKIVALVKANDTSPFTPTYKNDQYTLTDPEIVTTLVSHYLQAIEARAIAQKCVAIFGGKSPHQAGIIQGGVTYHPNLEDLVKYKESILKVIDFVENVYWKDILFLGAGPLLPVGQAGLGGGYNNYLSGPEFQADENGKDFLWKGGVVTDGNLGAVQPLDGQKIAESVAHSWYDYSNNQPLLAPYEGQTKFNLTKEGAYSFIKAPRYDGKPYEVGPLAWAMTTQPKEFMDVVTKLNIKQGFLARHAARSYQAVDVARNVLKWVDQLAELMGKGPLIVNDDKPTPNTGKGAGFVEAPRGFLSHWAIIEGGKLKNYQQVVPTTWNGSPRDANNVRGQYEQSLIGIPVPDPENPINVVRNIRSFDPCLACAVHIIHPESNRILKFVVE
jgi:hydrogenase large subunit